jgi:hydrogenase large subunit
MSPHITIDPITRIEGHLRVHAEVEGNRVTNSWVSGQMWRGLETILKGRDPREAWLFTQRICGVCTSVHAIASVRAVENALDLTIPLNAQYIRNLILIGHTLHDHIVHFYHLSALDWVDVLSALDADPRAAAKIAESLSDWPGNSYGSLAAAQARLKSLVGSGQLGIFDGGYWGHAAMHLPPEVNLLGVAHYLEALEYQRYANQAVAILGGKTPNLQNLAVGGVANAIDFDNQTALNMDKLWRVKALLAKVTEFVEKVYLADVIAIGAMYPEWLSIGAGVTNYLAVPDLPLDEAGTAFETPGGTIHDADLSSLHAILDFKDPTFRSGVTESIARSWYAGDWTRHPFDEETVPDYTDFDPDGKYSWVKAPRFEGLPMQVGPLAQVLVAYASGHPTITYWVDQALSRASAIAGVELTPAVLHSTAGRHLARAIRARVLGDYAEKHWKLLDNNIHSGDTSVCNAPIFPAGEQQGFGFHEAPRGSLSHWIVIEDGRIKNYQCVVPSTWNASPRDAAGQPGPYEASLLGTPVADPERPLELLRTIHSFDPCLACAIHTHDPRGAELATVRAFA